MAAENAAPSVPGGEANTMEENKSHIVRPRSLKRCFHAVSCADAAAERRRDRNEK